MNKLKNKKSIFKKVGWIFIGLFFCTLIYTPKIQPIAEPLGNSFEILEIEPGNQFMLGNLNKNIGVNKDFAAQEIIDGASIEPNLIGKKIRITYVTMQQFISQVDQINGKYDAVVIGRDNVGLRNGHNNPTETELNGYIYGDYTNQFSDTSKKPNLVDEGYIPEGFNWSNIKNGNLVDNKAYYEFYSENDITKKRAKEIISLIDSGQPVYIDDKIFDGSLLKTNLVSQFEGKINNKNCWKFSGDTNGILVGENFNDPTTNGMSLLNKIVINNIKITEPQVTTSEQVTTSAQVTTNNGISTDGNIENKRPVLSVTAPLGDSSGKVGNIKNRKMKFNINISDNVIKGETLKVNFYLDLSGDTIFSDKELYYQQEITINDEKRNYRNIIYNMSKDFIGYLEWKVEIVRTLKDENGNNLKDTNGNNIEVKSYKTGNLTLNPLQDQAPKVINVLQICPGKDTNNTNNMDLSVSDPTKSKFAALLQSVKGYDIKIELMNVTQFNKAIDENNKNNEGLDDKNKKSFLNGKYNMVIMGFSDSYGGANSDAFSDDSITEIKSFIQIGQSVMFTHDTMPITIKDSSKGIVGGKTTSIFTPTNGAKKLGQNFRDNIGQARYQDENNMNEKDIYKEYIAKKDENGFINGGEYVERNIPHDKIQSNNTSTYSYGYASDIITGCGVGANIQTDSKGLDKVVYNYSYSNSDKVYKISDGLITQYPFILGDINVAFTHHEWYQLNLEDPDVVPWYTMKLDTQTGSNEWKNQYLDKYDARNNYYTYSKGNITFSGTGHSGMGGKTDELKLFINTIIKADRGANHIPEIISSIPNEDIDNTINEVSADEDYIFKVDSNDLDKDLVYMNVTIDGYELTDENVDMTKLSKNEDNKQQYIVDTKNNSRKALEVKIPGAKLPKDKEVTIKIQTEDTQGAKSEKNYKIKAVPAPQFKVTSHFVDITKVDDKDQPIVSEVIHNHSIKVNADDIVKVKYDINPEELTYGNADADIAKNVAIILDTSINSQVMTSVAEGIGDAMFSDENFVKKENGNTQFDVIKYGNGTVHDYTGDNIINSEDKDSSGVNVDYQKELKDRLLKISTDDLYANDLEGAIGVAQDEFFNYYGAENSSKTIIIISCGNPTGDIQNLASVAKENNYNIITLAISDDFKAQNPYEQLRNWHNQLGGLPKDYYISQPDGDGKTTHKDIISDIMPKISQSLNSMKYKTYIIKDVQLNFNLGENIDLVGDGLVKKDLKNETSNEYIKNVSDIKYMATKQSDGSLLYKGYPLNIELNAIDKKYYLDFKIKANITAKGICNFAEPNKLTYKSTINQPMEYLIDETPILILNNILKVDHGVYQGLTDYGKAEYIENANTKKFSDDSIITFAANINDLYEEKNKLMLTIDPNSEIYTVPTIYKFNTTENILEKLKDSNNNDSIFTTSDNKNYEFNEFNGTKNNNIVVFYSVKLKGFDDLNKEYEYKNTITVNGKSANASVSRKIKSTLPDLF